MKATLRDDSLPHQIRLTFDPDHTNLIVVSCRCLREARKGRGPRRYTPLEKRPKWEADEALAVWRMHVLESVPVEEAEASDA